MKISFMLILTTTLNIIFTSCAARPFYFENTMPLSNINSTTEITQDAKYFVKNISEFQNLIQKASKTLEDHLTLYFTNYDHTLYAQAIQEIEFLTFTNFSWTTRGSETILELDLTYSESFRLLQGVQNTLAYEKLSSIEKEFLKEVHLILDSLALDSLTDFEKQLAIHDYIIHTTRYDEENLKNGTLPATAYRASGVLMYHSAVCQGYSEAMQLLLTLTGIESKIVTGVANGQNHAWNMVKLEDEWYMVDATWDDPVFYEKGVRQDYLSHEYFNVTSEKLSKTHSWNQKNYPIATGTKYHYYRRVGAYFTNYMDFKAYVTAQILSGQKEITCYIEAYSPSLYSLDFIFDYHNGSLSYVSPQNHEGTFTLILE